MQLPGHRPLSWHPWPAPRNCLKQERKRSIRVNPVCDPPNLCPCAGKVISTIGLPPAMLARHQSWWAGASAERGKDAQSWAAQEVQPWEDHTGAARARASRGQVRHKPPTSSPNWPRERGAGGLSCPFAFTTGAGPEAPEGRNQALFPPLYPLAWPTNWPIVEAQSVWNK